MDHQHLYGMKVLTTLNTGWMHMGRTIALKLSQEEEQVVAQLNKQGMTKSELLRNALRQYIEYLHQTTALNTMDKNLSFSQDKASIMFQDSLRNIINEIEELRGALKKTQEEMQNEKAKINQTISEFCIDATVIQKKPISNKTEVPNDVHHEIDEFLEQRMTHGDTWKKRV